MEMNAGEQPVIGISTKYEGPGTYMVEVCRSVCLRCVLEDVLSAYMVLLANFSLQTSAGCKYWTFSRTEQGSAMQVPCPRTRSTATVHIEMVDSNQMVFSDSFALSFHFQFHRLLKWLLVLPFVACAVAVASLPIEQAAASLPSFMRPSAAAP